MVMALGLSACSVSYTEKTLRSCSPSYSVSHPDGGTISVQQAGRGSAVQWGLFTIPKYKIGSRFDVEVFLGGGKKNVDAFHNNYEPHGSLPPSVIARYSGRLFEVRGVVTHGGDTLSFSAKCILA
jgi:hypothetical protein